MLRLLEILEPVLAEVQQADAGWQPADNEIARRGRQHHLAAVARCRYAGGAMDIEADVLVSDAADLAGMNAHAHGDPYV